MKDPAAYLADKGHPARLPATAALALLLSGCAFAYPDKDGNTHIAGLFVHVTVPKSADAREVRAESVRVQSIGLSLLTGMQRTNLTLGYNDDTLTLVHADSCGPAPQNLKLLIQGKATDAP